MARINKKLNPTRMTSEVRAKLRKAKLGSGKKQSYTKYYGVHEHRVVAERILGRKLKSGEVVHHIDGNNNPENLHIFSSQKEHAEHHQFLVNVLGIKFEGGDAL